MKNMLMLAAAGIAVFAFAKPSNTKLTNAEIEKRDQANWGGVDYSAAMDGETPVINDYTQIGAKAKNEVAKMRTLHGKLDALVKGGAKIVDMDLDAVMGDALKDLTGPIDPTPPRTHSNMNATPGQKKGFQSIIGAKKALAKFDKTVRVKMRDLLKAELETRIYYDYSRMVRVATYESFRNGRILDDCRQIDAGWGKFRKLLKDVDNGTDKWKYTISQLLDPEQKKRLYAELVKESGLDLVFSPDGSIQPKVGRVLLLMDNYFKRVTDNELNRMEISYKRCSDAHEAAVAAQKEFTAWFGDNGMSLDPHPRKMIHELLLGHAEYTHASRDTIGKCMDVVKELREEGTPVGKLRKCKGFSPNNAFYIKRKGVGAGEPPEYFKRVTDLMQESKKLFEEAVEKRRRALRIQL